eukprot:3895347-Rhodomonas_salina.3
MEWGRRVGESDLLGVRGSVAVTVAAEQCATPSLCARARLSRWRNSSAALLMCFLSSTSSSASSLSATSAPSPAPAIVFCFR